jgi:beta-aspartyl-dipeptidase (metallo-type)
LGLGMDADLLILDQTKRISHVMAKGHWHVFENKLVKKGTFED